MDNIKNKIKELRVSKNLTQQQLADELHVTKQAISKWEKGKSVPDIASVESMSEFFGVSVDYLINDNIEAAKSDTATGTQFKYFNKLNIVLISVIALMLAAIVALSVAMGVLVNKFNEFDKNTSDAPDIVEVNGLQISYISTSRLELKNASFYVEFNVYNLLDIRRSFCTDNFSLDNMELEIFDSFELNDLPAHHDYITRIKIRTYYYVPLKNLKNRSVTIKYAGHLVTKITL